MSLIEFLDVIYCDRDLDCALTVREYLKKLLSKVWSDDECFNGKRPFGNSGWKYENGICAMLIKHGLLEGKLDADGDVVVAELNKREANKIMLQVIQSM